MNSRWRCTINQQWNRYYDYAPTIKFVACLKTFLLSLRKSALPPELLHLKNSLKIPPEDTRLFGLAVPVWPIRSEPLRSGDISVRLWHLAELLHVNILMQTYLNQREVLVKKNTNIIQDPTVN